MRTELQKNSSKRSSNGSTHSKPRSSTHSKSRTSTSAPNPPKKGAENPRSRASHSTFSRNKSNHSGSRSATNDRSKYSPPKTTYKTSGHSAVSKSPPASKSSSKPRGSKSPVSSGSAKAKAGRVLQQANTMIQKDPGMIETTEIKTTEGSNTMSEFTQAMTEEQMIRKLWTRNTQVEVLAGPRRHRRWYPGKILEVFRGKTKSYDEELLEVCYKNQNGEKFFVKVERGDRKHIRELKTYTGIAKKEDEHKRYKDRKERNNSKSDAKPKKNRKIEDDLANYWKNITRRATDDEIRARWHTGSKVMYKDSSGRLRKRKITKTTQNGKEVQFHANPKTGWVSAKPRASDQFTLDGKKSAARSSTRIQKYNGKVKWKGVAQKVDTTKHRETDSVASLREVIKTESKDVEIDFGPKQKVKRKKPNGKGNTTGKKNGKGSKKGPRKSTSTHHGKGTNKVNKRCGKKDIKKPRKHKAL